MTLGFLSAISSVKTCLLIKKEITSPHFHKVRSTTRHITPETLQNITSKDNTRSTNISL